MSKQKNRDHGYTHLVHENVHEVAPALRHPVQEEPEEECRGQQHFLRQRGAERAVKDAVQIVDKGELRMLRASE